MGDKEARVTEREDGMGYRCQFCLKSAPVRKWKKGGFQCPHCRRMYDWMLAQDSEE